MAELSGNNPVFQGGCSETTGTRTQILSLRNSSSLTTGCPYVITGYVRGCLTATEIVLTATSVNSFSFDVDILTTFDTLHWEGRYDIDTNRVVALHDNIGNIVEGRLGNEVDRFPWGSAQVNGNIIQNADVYIDCANTQVISENTFNANSYVDLRGFQGVFYDNTVDSYGRIYLNAAQQVDIRRNKFQSYSYNYYQGQTNVYLRQSTFQSNSYVRKFSGTDLFQIIDTTVAAGDIRHYDGQTYISDSVIKSGGRVYQQGSNRLDIRNSTVSDLSYILNQHTGAVADYTRFWYSNLKSLSYHYIRAGVTAGRHFYYYSNFSSGQVDIQSGTGLIRFYYVERNSNGYIRIDNQTGILNLYQTHVASRGEIRLNGTAGTNTLYYSNFHGYQARVSLTNTTAFYIYSLTCQAGGQYDATGGSPRAYYSVVDSFGRFVATNATTAGYLYESNIQSRGRFITTGTGRCYRSTIGSQAYITANNFQFNTSTAFGPGTTTLTANNTNRGKFHALVNDLI